MDATDEVKPEHIRKWIDSEEEENNQFLTDDNIIEEVMAVEKDDVEKGWEAITIQSLILLQIPLLQPLHGQKNTNIIILK